MIKNGWYCCPYCGKKLFPVEPDTTAHNLPQRCKACKRQLYVNIPPVPSAKVPSADCPNPKRGCGRSALLFSRKEGAV